MCDYVCLFLEAPLQGRFRIDDGDMWNANDPHVWTQEERAETQGEPCILHTGHGDLEFQKKSDVVSWCFMVFIYTCWIDWEYLLFFGEFSCELMTRKPTSKVDDLRSTYLMKITDVSTNQNPYVMGLFIWRSRKNSGYCWGKKSTFLVAGTAPLDALLPLVHWCVDRWLDHFSQPTGKRWEILFQANSAVVSCEAIINT